LRAALETVAARLGNTLAICRKCYVHPEVLNAFLDGTLRRELTARSGNLSRDMAAELAAEFAPDEAAVLTLLRSRLKATNTGANGAEKVRQQLAGSVRRMRSRRAGQASASRETPDRASRSPAHAP
jgi:DNA topoisomerase I